MHRMKLQKSCENTLTNFKLKLLFYVVNKH